MKKVVVLIDANNFAFAAFHTHRELATSDGEPTGLVYGTLTGLLALARLFPGSPLVLVWDGKGGSWRKKVAPNRYKAQRKYDGDAVRASCLTQIDVLMKILDYLQVPQMRLDGVEADDLIGILATEFQKTVDQVIIRSSDKDFYQLLGTKVQILRGQVKRSLPLNAANVWQNLVTEKNIPQGISPKRWVTFRALCGDSSDNLKGLVSGCGEVAAATLVASGIKLPATGSPSLKKITRLQSKEILRADWERVNENFLLSTILTDYRDSRIPLEAQKEIQKFLCRWSENGFQRNIGKIDRWSLLKMLGRLEMDTLGARFRELIKIF